MLFDRWTISAFVESRRISKNNKDNSSSRVWRPLRVLYLDRPTFRSAPMIVIRNPSEFDSRYLFCSSDNSSMTCQESVWERERERIKRERKNNLYNFAWKKHLNEIFSFVVPPRNKVYNFLCKLSALLQQILPYSVVRFYFRSFYFYFSFWVSKGVPTCPALTQIPKFVSSTTLPLTLRFFRESL